MQGVRGRRGATHRTAALGVVALLVGSMALGACGSSPRSADDVLASAQEFVSDATAFQFDGVAEVTYVTEAGDYLDDEWGNDSDDEPRWSSGGAGTTTTDRSTLTGTWTSDAWETRSQDSFGRTEQRGFGSTAYSRDDMDGELGEWAMWEIPKWTHDDMVAELEAMQEPVEGPDDEEMDISEIPGASVGIAAELYLGGEGLGGSDLLSDPSGFIRAIEDLSDPEIGSRDGATVTLEVEVSAPADMEEAWGAPLPTGHVTLAVGLDGAPIGLTLAVGEGDDSVDIKIRFSDWNVPAEIARPSDDEIDQTPWLDEEGVAAVPGIQLLRPTAFPDGWELDSVEAYSADDSFEGCAQVELYWSPMLSEDGEVVSDDYLDLYLVPLDCALDGNSTPFEVGPYAPLPSRESDFGTEVLVGDTVVQLDTTLRGSELAALIASIAPTDLATLSAEMGEGSSFLLES